MREANMRRTIDPTTIRDEPNVLQLVHEVLECGIYDVEQFRFDKTLDNPERIPIVCEG